MATSVLKILLSLIVLLSFHGLKVDAKVERYAFNIVENGASFNEEVEVDVDEQKEVIRVPQHNSVGAMDVMNDFEVGLTVRRVPSTKDCYVSKLDSSFPSPEKLRRDMDQASRQSLPDKVEIGRTVLQVLGFADRLALPQRILDFCGNFPITRVEEISLDSMNTTMVQEQGHGRRKRSHYWSDWKGCSSSEAKIMNDCLARYQPSQIKLLCKYQTTTCYYYARCAHRSGFSFDYYCNLIVHRYNYQGICCTPSC
ncbi:uncharacterized protein LOC110064010 [Orbicella faveolata]|uniref:uncharacterized protein LOC110064010 n=1 Tax=Orbicella faveolata TaxID=48498 RepID=UPI0009E56B15|nr:uncharacterized protein LOC110064010 [Orbicella faveolata]